MSIGIERRQSRMKLRKIFASLALIFLLTPLGMIGQGEARAAEMPEEVTFVLHKRVFLDSKKELSLEPNSGLELEKGDLVDSTKTYGQNGVVFEVYDATEYVMSLLAVYPQEEVKQHFLNADPDDLRSILTKENLLVEVTTGREGGENGIAMVTLDFSKMPTDSSAVLFLQKESTSPSAIVQEVSAPMLVSLPIINPINEKEFLSVVHLYPKSVLRGQLPQTGGEDPKPSITPDPTPTPKPLPRTGGLPQTGEAKTMMGIIGFVVVGMVIVFWKKRHPRNEG